MQSSNTQVTTISEPHIASVPEVTTAAEEHDLLQTVNENGAPAVTAGPDGGAVHAQKQRGDALEIVMGYIAEAFGSDSRGKTFEIVATFVAACFDAISDDVLSEALELLAVYLCNLRDVRGGKGEKDLTVMVILEMCKYRRELVRMLLPLLVSEFGSYGDIFRIYLSAEDEDPEIRSFIQDACKEIIELQLIADDEELTKSASGGGATEGKPKVSLACKWAPAEKTGKTNKNPSKRATIQNRMTNEVAFGILRRKFPSPKHLEADGVTPKPSSMSYALREYRKMRARLNKHIKVVEQMMCDGNWSSVEPSRVPACALNKYRNAFRNKMKDGKTQRSEDPDRVACAEKFDDATKKCIETGEGLHGTVKGADGICQKYVRGFGSDADPVIEAQWQNLLKETRDKFAEGGGLPPCVALVDVSGSMNGIPMEVAVALGLLVAETAPEGWRNRVITFHEDPTWHQIRGDTLKEKVYNLMRAPWGGSTNFAKALNMILSVATESHIPQEDMPKVLFVFSDMCWDAANGSHSGYRGSHYYRDGAESSTGFNHGVESARRAFVEAGYEPPHIVLWNLRGEVTTRACETISTGVSQMSGYSQVMLKHFMEGTMLDMIDETPSDRVMKVLEDPAYDKVREIVREHLRESSGAAAEDG
jgi:hypothetical protein